MCRNLTRDVDEEHWQQQGQIRGYVNATKAAEPGAQCAAMCTPPAQLLQAQ